MVTSLATPATTGSSAFLCGGIGDSGCFSLGCAVAALRLIQFGVLDGWSILSSHSMPPPAVGLSMISLDPSFSMCRRDGAANPVAGSVFRIQSMPWFHACRWLSSVPWWKKFRVSLHRRGEPVRERRAAIDSCGSRPGRGHDRQGPGRTGQRRPHQPGHPADRHSRRRRRWGQVGSCVPELHVKGHGDMATATKTRGQVHVCSTSPSLASAKSRKPADRALTAVL